MQNVDRQYEDNVKKIIETGHDHGDRTGVGRRSLFGLMERYDLSDGTVPVPTTRKIYHTGNISELCFFIHGKTDIADLHAMGNKFWDRWAVKEEDVTAFIEKHKDKIPPHVSPDAIKHQMLHRYLGSIGPMYGAMWRNAPMTGAMIAWPLVPLDELPSDKLEAWQKDFDEITADAGDQQIPFTFEEFCSSKYYETKDQLNELIRNLKKRPYSSRHSVYAHVPEYVPFEEMSPQENVLCGKGALAACHDMFQCMVYPPKEPGGKKRLSLRVDVRSNDMMVGKPHNQTQYAVLLHLLAHVTGMDVFEMVYIIGDAHLYFSHIDKAKEQIKLEPYPFPKIKINPELKDIFKVQPSDIEIIDYQSHPGVSYDLAV